MTRLEKVFENNKALISFITAGDPDLDTTRSLVRTLEEAGSDIIELGVPFSDPQADGPVIQSAGQRALKAGTTLSKVIQLAGELEEKVSVPLVLMGYFNPIMTYGQEKFANDAAKAGIAGVIVPDLPFDEGEKFYSTLNSHGVDSILMVTPNTAEERLIETGRRARGFVYCVSMLGITGQIKGFYREMEEYISRVRKHVTVPVALGFGVDGPQKASMAAPIVDGVVVGSAIVRLVEKYGNDKEKLLKEVKTFVSALKKAVR